LRLGPGDGGPTRVAARQVERLLRCADALPAECLQFWELRLRLLIRPARAAELLARRLEALDAGLLILRHLRLRLLNRPLEPLHRGFALPGQARAECLRGWQHVRRELLNGLDRARERPARLPTRDLPLQLLSLPPDAEAKPLEQRLHLLARDGAGGPERNLAEGRLQLGR
jgi:hypothetical protein